MNSHKQLTKLVQGTLGAFPHFSSVLRTRSLSLNLVVISIIVIVVLLGSSG